MDHETYMKQALGLALRAAEAGEVPVGALVVCNGQVIAEAWNQKEASGIPTHHAEILALEAAASRLGRWRLSDCDLYVTLEPCPMCAGALVQARVRRVVYGTVDPKAGAAKSLYQILTDPRLNHRCEVEEGVLRDECAQVLKDFFKSRRLSASTKDQAAD